MNCIEEWAVVMTVFGTITQKIRVYYVTQYWVADLQSPVCGKGCIPKLNHITRSSCFNDSPSENLSKLIIGLFMSWPLYGWQDLGLVSFCLVIAISYSNGWTASSRLLEPSIVKWQLASPGRIRYPRCSPYLFGTSVLTTRYYIYQLCCRGWEWQLSRVAHLRCRILIKD